MPLSLTCFLQVRSMFATTVLGGNPVWKLTAWQLLTMEAAGRDASACC